LFWGMGGKGELLEIHVRNHAWGKKNNQTGEGKRKGEGRGGNKSMRLADGSVSKGLYTRSKKGDSHRPINRLTKNKKQKKQKVKTGGDCDGVRSEGAQIEKK